MIEDLEKANGRATAAEKEVEMLRERLESEKEMAGGASRREEDGEGSGGSEATILALQRELSAKEREVEHLLTDLQKEKLEREEEKEEAETKLAGMEKRRAEDEKRIKEVEGVLERQADYDSIKKDLSIMRSVEFQEEEGDGGETRPLEVMILERSKALQSENTTLRVEKDQATTELGEARSELKEKAAEVERQQNLIAELEDHVEKLQEMSNRGEAEGRSSADILVDTLDPLLSQSTTSSPGNQFSMDMPVSSSSGSKAALLPIVQAQRERFKQRNEELEEEASRQTQQVQLLQAEVRELRGDNVKLYEKIRFLQGYQGGRVAPSSSQHSGNDVAIPVENRYRQQYEQKMDPFHSFSQQERHRRFGQLNVFEKIIYSFVQVLLPILEVTYFII